MSLSKRTRLVSKGPLCARPVAGVSKRFEEPRTSDKLNSVDYNFSQRPADSNAPQPIASTTSSTRLEKLHLASTAAVQSLDTRRRLVN